MCVCLTFVCVLRCGHVWQDSDGCGWTKHPSDAYRHRKGNKIKLFLLMLQSVRLDFVCVSESTCSSFYWSDIKVCVCAYIHVFAWASVSVDASLSLFWESVYVCVSYYVPICIHMCLWLCANCANEFCLYSSVPIAHKYWRPIRHVHYYPGL